ncbi:MAG: DUF3801 domain-containing protein [Arcanobacterium sp.]
MSIAGIESIGERVTMVAAEKGIQVTARLTAKLTNAALRQIGEAVARLSNRHSSGETSSEMSLPELHQSNRGDIHPLEIPDSMVDEVRADFNERGVAFAIEQGQDGATYVHFKGADADSVRHGIDQVAAKLDKTLAPSLDDVSEKHSPVRPPQTRADVAKVIEGKAAEKTRQAARKAPSLTPEMPVKAPQR